MRIMNDLDLKLKELGNMIDQIQETVQSFNVLLSNNKDEALSADEQSQRNPIKNKAIHVLGNTKLKQKAELAFAGKGTICYDTWCQFSACNAVLPARYNYHHKLTRFQLWSPNLLTNIEVIEVLEHIDDLNRWAHKDKDHAADLAINHDKQWPSYKIAEGRSIRHYKNEAAVVEIAEANSYHNIYKKKLLPITKLEKRLSKKKFTELFSQEIIKPTVKPTLVQVLISARVLVNQTSRINLRRKNNMSQQTKVVTGINTRLSYANVWEPKAINGGKKKYSVSLIIPKSDQKTIASIEKAINAAIQEGISKFGGKKPNKVTLKLPLRNGDAERHNSAYKNSYFINANSITAPQIVDKHVQPILDRNEVYSGCYARVSINFYAFNKNGNRGIACGLRNIQKIRDGKPLGRHTSANDDFTSININSDNYFLA